MKMGNIIEANAPFLVPSKAGFAPNGFLPYCGTFDLNMKTRIWFFGSFVLSGNISKTDLLKA